MRVYDLILKKRNGEELSREEIEFLVAGFTAGHIPDYQISAWSMAVYFRGMSAAETTALTLAMMESGETIDLSAIAGTKVDKHSTGGVGDTTTLVLAPLVAACGAPVAKMSGRSLGHTGGTLDKLESIPGFQIHMDSQRFIDAVNRLNVAVIGQTAALAPADARFYELRDVTATVESIPLMAASIMSKKLAAGANALVLDVKTGRGAFMTDPEDANRLARTMVAIGQRAGRETVAFVTDMDEPLGYAIGNTLELHEAIATLKGEGPADLMELCLALGAEMLVLAGVAADENDARRRLHDVIRSGAALAKFREMVANQGGDVAYVDEPDLLPKAPVVAEISAPAAGRIGAVDGLRLGLTTMQLGAGRHRTEDDIDHRVGIVLRAKVGSEVAEGEPLCEVHAADEAGVEAVQDAVRAAFSIVPDAPAKRPLILQRITATDAS